MNREIESAVVASVLIDIERVSQIVDKVKPDMFNDPFLKEVYKEILKAYDIGRSITIVELSQKLECDTCSREYITQTLKDCVLNVNSWEIMSYADALINEYKADRLKGLIKKTVPAAGRIGEQINYLLQELEALKDNENRKIRAIGEVVAEVSSGYFKEYDANQINTGFGKLDDITGGLEGGDVIVIGARPAVGKSAFVSQIALHMASNGKKVGFYNLEMSDKQVYERLLSGISGIGLTRIRRAKRFIGDEQERFDCANKALSKITLFIRSGSVSVSQIRNECRHLELDCIIIDYLQLLKSDIKYQNRTSEVGAISKAIKALAMELNIPVVVLSQLNRASEARENKEPTMSELREAGDIEQDASVILLLWNVSQAECEKKGLKVEKNRQGKRGAFVLRFDGDSMRFHETNESIQDLQKGFQVVEEPTPFD